jgi:hypothetical protein
MYNFNYANLIKRTETMTAALLFFYPINNFYDYPQLGD